MPNLIVAGNDDPKQVEQENPAGRSAIASDMAFDRRRSILDQKQQQGGQEQSPSPGRLDCPKKTSTVSENLPGPAGIQSYVVGIGIVALALEGHDWGEDDWPFAVSTGGSQQREGS